MRPGRATPLSVLFLLHGNEGLAARSARARAADLDLGSVDPQLDALGIGVGEQVLNRVQPQSGPVGDGEAAGRQQWPRLADRPGDGGAVHCVELGERRVWQAQRRCTSVTSSRSTNTSRRFGPAPAARRGLPPRRSCNADSLRLPIGGRVLRATRRSVRGRCRTGRDGNSRAGTGKRHNSPNPCISVHVTGRPPLRLRIPSSLQPGHLLHGRAPTTSLRSPRGPGPFGTPGGRGSATPSSTGALPGRTSPGPGT